MNNKHDQHCKAIADKLESIAEGSLYKCPECGEWIQWNDAQYNEESAEYTCQECGAVFEESDLESVSFYDYFENMLDIDFVTTREKQYKACRIMVAWGGPNIYINTWDKQVELFWWTESGRAYIDSNTCDAIDEWAEEYFACL